MNHEGVLDFQEPFDIDRLPVRPENFQEIAEQFANNIEELFLRYKKSLKCTPAPDGTLPSTRATLWLQTRKNKELCNVVIRSHQTHEMLVERVSYMERADRPVVREQAVYYLDEAAVLRRFDIPLRSALQNYVTRESKYWSSISRVPRLERSYDDEERQKRNNKLKTDQALGMNLQPVSQLELSRLSRLINEMTPIDPVFMP